MERASFNRSNIGVQITGTTTTTKTKDPSLSSCSDTTFYETMEVFSFERPSIGVNKKNFRRNKIRSIEAMIPTTKAHMVMKRLNDYVDFFGKPLGWKMDYKWKSNPKHWCVFVNFIFFLSQCIYSQLKHFMNNDYKRVFHVLPVLGVGLVRLLELQCFQSYVKEITALNCFNLKLCRQNFGKLLDKLEKQQSQNMKMLKCGLLAALIAALAYVYNTIKSIVFDRELVSLLPIEIMFTDQSKLTGFLIANSVMLIGAVYSALVAIYLGSHFVFVAMNCSMQLTLIQADLSVLDKLWDDTSETSVSERHLFLRNICLKCQDKENYISIINRVFEKTVYLFFCLTYVSQIVCLYMIKVENWIPGYGMSLGLFLEMMFYCLVGTQITTANEKLCYIITQSNWYRYDSHSQKTILLLLQSCMNSNELWIGPLAPLSVFTGTEIVKSIYSYYTILVEIM